MLASAIAPGGPLEREGRKGGLSWIDAARFSGACQEDADGTNIGGSPEKNPGLANRGVSRGCFAGTAVPESTLAPVGGFLGPLFFFGTGFIEGVSACLVAAAGFKPVVRSGNRSQVGSIPIHSRQFGGNCVLRQADAVGRRGAVEGGMAGRFRPAALALR